MTRILIVVLAVILVGSISFFYLFIQKSKDEPSVISPENNPQQQDEKSFQKTTSTSGQASGSAIETRLKTLEVAVIDLQKQINANKDASSSSKTVVTQKAPFYIPLGNGASSASLSWQTSDAVQATIDPGLYPGYSSMQLEMGLQVFQGNGQAYARLYDFTDSQAISGSDVSSTAQTFTWVSSSGFRLPAGSKVYKLQLYTNTTYEASEQNARIKVNF